MRFRNPGLRALAASFAVPLAAVVFSPAVASAQDEGGPPSPEDVRKKVVEIEKLMKQAEDSLSRSLDSTSAEARAKRAAKLLDERARETTGKSADELRKLAESGAKDAAETLRRLTEESQRSAEGATEGVRRLLEETKQGGQGASAGIRWILEKAVQQSKRPGQQSPSPQPPKDGHDPQGKDPKKDPKSPEESKDPKDRQTSDDPPPPSDREKPRDPRFEKWFAELPPQVRKAYETQDWDSVPPKWREMLRAWTKRMADDLEKERK